MAHWFHRNPLKATSKVNFELKLVASTTGARQICSELMRTRNKLLDILADPNLDVKIMEEAAKHYLSLLNGFLYTVDEGAAGDSKLRNIIKFRWTNTLCGSTPSEHFDSYFELYSVVFDIGLWFSKHAAKIAGAKDDPSVDEAKEVHKCLRIAAGIFQYVKDEVGPALLDRGDKTHDTDARIIEAYVNQCTAEAQEITLARAIELKHAVSLRSSLAYETSKLFEAADLGLNTSDDSVTEKWRKYLQLKAAFYMSYAYSFHGEDLLAQDKCGEAIACLRESVKYFQKSSNLCKEYTSAKGAGSTVKPAEHCFFRKLGRVVKLTLEKCERENDFIYHHKVPSEVPELELKATFGLVKPEKYELPPRHEMWNKDIYAAFDITKNDHATTSTTDPKKKKEEEGEIPPVKEADIKTTSKDPSNFSGCIVS
ncbi:BRO1 domain-containing protein BROX-like [Tubulanus polymorphus]|uniref:BRO1 domain-containing protein BROX-like n=1 Tax=Tubulanus polymorphus TaxID=672921 RepID=UPI003DA26912